MSQQLQITGGAKVRSLEGVITGSTGVLGSLPINASNGIPQLDVNGKILVSQLPNSVMEYKGTWNAATNTPTLADGTGNQGDVYLCNVAGTVNFGSGPISFVVGDQVIYSGTIWQKASGATGTVTSVAVTESGDALSITGSPITTSGTINIGFAGTSAQYVAGDGSLITFPTVVTQAQNLVTEVYNETGATLTKGTVVYINGGHGNLPTITKAIATGDSTSAQTYGVVRTDITNNNNGYVTVIGNLDNLDTQAYAPGTQLYLSSTTAGAWTDVKQYAPAHLVYVGIVVRSHPTQGVVEIRIQNGFEMDELHNVAAQSPSNGSILQYVSSTALWTSVAGTTTNIAEGTNLYFTDARARAALSATTPLSYNNTTGAFSISQATTSTSGFLSSTDWNTFNNKQNALTNPITGTGVSGRIPYFNGTTTQTSSANLTWDNTNSILGTTSILATTDVAAYNLTINGIDFGKIQNITGQSWGLAYASSGASNALGSSALVWNTTGNVIIINKLNVGNYNNTYNLDITGTARISGQLTLGSTITNGTYTYTLPGATGTLALTSDLSSYLPLSGGTLTGALSGTSATFSGNIVSQGSYVDLQNTSYIRFSNAGGGTRWGYIQHDGTNMAFANDISSGVFSFNKNVGIGTSSPSANLHVNAGSANLSQDILIVKGGGTSGAYGLSVQANNGQAILRTDNYTYNVLMCENGGNVGIGTSSPTDKLVVSNAGANTLHFDVEYSGGASTIYSYNRTTNAYTNLQLSASNLIFQSNGTTERMRITSGGDVCINSTTTSNSAKLYVNGLAAFGSVFVGSLGTGTVYSSSGTLTNTNPSDKRLKDNITPITYGLNEVLQLNPVSFDWKNDNNKNKQFGFIAQEVQEVMPEAVIEGEYLGLEKDAIYTALVNAIKELKKEIDELKNK